jgi:serine/threonine protein kinase
MALSEGTLLNNRYRIVSVLGQGGMGAVYQAEDTLLSVAVAVKENLFLSDEYTRQFLQEAKILAGMRHPSLPRVRDYFQVESQGQYLIMDFIDGEDLRQKIERLGKLPEQETVLIGAVICDALNHMHTRVPPIIHRDIKPGNIKISPDGEVVLVDFGLAKVMLDSQDTRTGARAMTPGYSPPEQYGTAHTDARSDIYSLGATLYAVLTGIIPEDSLIRATRKAKLTPIRDLRPDIHSSLASVIEKSLSIEPNDRFQTAAEFGEALMASLDISPLTQPRVPSLASTNGEFIPLEKNPVNLSRKTPIFINNSKQKKLPGWLKYGLASCLLLAIGWGLFSLIPNSAIENEPSPDDSEIPGIVPTIADKDAETEPDIIDILPTAEETLQITPNIEITQEIAFVSDRTGSLQVWVMNKDGSDQYQITNMPGGACQPNWSPDGKKMAVISPCEKIPNTVYYNNADIFIMNADGSDIEKIPASSGRDFDPAWSPDGNRIAFTSLRNERAHIFIYNFVDGSLQEVSDTHLSDMQPAWHPNGRQLAFVRTTYYNHIWIMSDRGLTQFQFSTSGNVNDAFPVWSPDGKSLFFTRSQESPTIPWLLKLDLEDRGSEEQRIPPLTEQADSSPVSRPTISADGQLIAFESWPDGRNHDLFSMDMDGKNRLRLTTDPGLDTMPAWRPKTSQ